MLLGLTRIFLPRLWDQLLMAGFIQINGPPAEFLDRLSPPDQGIVMLLCASVLVVSGLGSCGWEGTCFAACVSCLAWYWNGCDGSRRAFGGSCGGAIVRSRLSGPYHGEIATGVCDIAVGDAHRIKSSSRNVPAWYHESIETAPSRVTTRSRIILLRKQHLTGIFPFAATLGLCYDGLASWIATAKLFRKIPKNGVDDTSE